MEVNENEQDDHSESELQQLMDIDENGKFLKFSLTSSLLITSLNSLFILEIAMFAILSC